MGTTALLLARHSKAKRWPTRAACAQVDGFVARRSASPLQSAAGRHAGRAARPAAGHRHRHHGRLHAARAGRRDAGARRRSRSRWSTSCNWRDSQRAARMRSMSIFPSRQLHPRRRRPRRPRTADAQGRQGDPGGHRAAGRRPGQRRGPGLCAARRAHRARGQARRLQEHAAGLHRAADDHRRARRRDRGAPQGRRPVHLRPRRRRGRAPARGRHRGARSSTASPPGLAAVTALGVPLTHRDHAQGVVFVTGHAKTGHAADSIRPTGGSWPPRRATRGSRW